VVIAADVNNIAATATVAAVVCKQTSHDFQLDQEDLKICCYHTCIVIYN